MSIEIPPKKSKADYMNLSEEQKNALTDDDAYDYMYKGTLGDHLSYPRIRERCTTAREAIEKMLYINTIGKDDV